VVRFSSLLAPVLISFVATLNRRTNENGRTVFSRAATGAGPNNFEAEYIQRALANNKKHSLTLRKLKECNDGLRKSIGEGQGDLAERITLHARVLSLALALAKEKMERELMMERS
jgi:hypothetical protein